MSPRPSFITRVSHELRTPLNSIKGSIYYLHQSDRLSRDEQKEFYEIIASETDKLIGIVENQLDFLRMEDETLIINKTVINLKEVLRDVLDSKTLKTLFARKGISTAVSIDDSISDIVGDKIRTAQFFLNIIEGLSHFTERGDVIAITVSENHCVHVSLTLPGRCPIPSCPISSAQTTCSRPTNPRKN